MDKIDVSKCEYYDDGNCDCYYDIECEERNCMYKQLQRYKQCLDDIKEHIETCKNTRYCTDCKFWKNCQCRNGWEWSDIVLYKIEKAKEGWNG